MCFRQEIRRVVHGMSDDSTLPLDVALVARVTDALVAAKAAQATAAGVAPLR